MKVNLLDLHLTLEAKKFDYTWNSIGGFWLILTHHLKNKWQMGNECAAKFWFHKSQHRKAFFYLPHYLLFCTMANSTNFRYLSLRKLQTSTSDAIIDTTFWSNDWCQKVELCMLLHLASFLNLNMSCWLSRSLAFKTLDTKVSTPSTNWVLPKQNVVSIT